MKPNVGTIDKIIRIVLAALAVILYFTNVISGTLGISMLVLAAILVLTSLVSFCPIWAVFGVNTGNKKQ
jgi:hypothetical protein